MLPKLNAFPKRLVIAGIATTALFFGLSTPYLQASDHDDGEVDIKGRNVNLTDLYVFREKDQNPAAKNDHLILTMNTNPRSLARQQYFFSQNARYNFHISRVSNVDAVPTGKADLTLQFQFNAPRRSGQQSFTMKALRNGKSLQSLRGQTTPIGKSPILNRGSIAGKTVTVFSGLREDPFFFDVEQFFRVRAGALGIGPQVGFRPPGKALDFAKGYNVNSIVVRVPRALLQDGQKQTTFDVWTTIDVKTSGGQFKQFERLARPGINEGLIVPNDLLNTFNSVPPSVDLTPAAAPVRRAARKTLLALGNDAKRAHALLNAFLPDVMRIDTTGPSGYGKALNALGAPVRGRLLKDDVIDTTLTVLTNGTVTTDNVSYKGAPGNPAQGHRPLRKQFPYLVQPH